MKNKSTIKLTSNQQKTTLLLTDGLEMGLRAMRDHLDEMICLIEKYRKEVKIPYEGVYRRVHDRRNSYVNEVIDE